MVYRWCTSARQPYVLLVHGWSSCAAAFLPWVRPLQQAGYAVVAFDQPGHGLSQGTRANLPDFVDALMAMTERYGSPAALVGHSLGGAAVAVALARGLDTKCAVLVSPAADLAAATQRFTRILRLPDDFSDQMVAAFEAGPVPIEALKAHRIAPHIKANVLVVHDAEDREIPCEEGQRYERFCPNASLIQTSGLGHSRILGDAGVIGAGIGFLAGKLQTEKNAASCG